MFKTDIIDKAKSLEEQANSFVEDTKQLLLEENARENDLLFAAGMNGAHIERILNGRKMGELPLLEQREIFQIGMECIALEMGAPAESIVHHKPLKVNMGDPFDCEHFADGEWHKVTIARTIYDYYRPIGEYPHKMEAFFADLCDPSRFRNFIYR